jgi:hypothetical protein
MNIIAPKIQPNKARAWFVTVFNPVIEALDAEIKSLNDMNYTYDSRSRRLLGVKPLEYWLDSRYLPNMEDVFKKIPELKGYFTRHDEQVEKLSALCIELHKQIKNSPHITDINTFVSRLSQDGHTTSLQHSLEQHEDSFRDYIAELLINNIKSLPTGHSFSPFFTVQYNSITPIQTLRLSLIDNSEGSIISQLEWQRKESLRHCSELRNELDTIRTTISDEIDVPIAPIQND